MRVLFRALRVMRLVAGARRAIVVAVVAVRGSARHVRLASITRTTNDSPINTMVPGRYRLVTLACDNLVPSLSVRECVRLHDSQLLVIVIGRATTHNRAHLRLLVVLHVVFGLLFESLVDDCASSLSLAVISHDKDNHARRGMPMQRKMERKGARHMVFEVSWVSC